MTRDRWMLGDLHVATLVWEDGDFPWAYGRIEPSPAFAGIERCFVPSASGDRWLDDEALAGAGHPPSSSRLVGEDDADADAVYLHTLVLRDRGAASWRCGPEPLDLDPG
ncbi:hypothetical protein [Dactylosporangium sp. NPDC048998]|uniref:hypothetical protein n=1 Tax=Dactylosporangium sp. NPDC048998 TaxID=3363976 RepID=UPI0037220B6A